MWLVKDSGVPEGSKLSLTLGLSHFCRIAAVPRPLRLQVTTSRQTERTEFALSFGFRSCSPAPHDDRSGAVSLVPLGRLQWGSYCTVCGNELATSQPQETMQTCFSCTGRGSILYHACVN